MTNSAQHRSWTLNLSSWPAAAALAMAIMFALTGVAPSAQAQTFKVLHTFTGGIDGAAPYAGLTMDRAGNLYGTAAFGGTGACENFQSPSGCGTVFRLVHTGSAWRFIPLYSFGGSATYDGSYPYGRVIFGSDGSLYGTSLGGGVQGNCASTLLIGCGTVFDLTSSNGSWTKTTLWSFQQAGPIGGVALDQRGYIYGTTDIGGQYTDGSVYQLTPSGSGWTLNTLYSFSGSDGYDVFAGVILDSTGNLYGATINGQPSGGAVVFKLTPSDGNWAYSALYTIPGLYGGGPAGDLVMDAAGNLYGTTRGAGFNSNLPNGSVFKLTPSNGGWIYTDLYNFTGGSDGSHPYSNVVIDAEGNLYGTTSQGGSGCNGLGCGVVWEITG